MVSHTMLVVLLMVQTVATVGSGLHNKQQHIKGSKGLSNSIYHIFPLNSSSWTKILLWGQ